MPWSTYVIGIGLLLVALPFIGEYFAVLVVFGSALAFVGVRSMLRLLGASDDITQIHWTLAAIAVAIAVVATWLIVRLCRAGVTQRQYSASLNGLMLVVGIPVLIALSFLRLGQLWR